MEITKELLDLIKCFHCPYCKYKSFDAEEMQEHLILCGQNRRKKSKINEFHELSPVEEKEEKIDPYDLRKVEKTLDPTSCTAYKTAWLRFLKSSKINRDRRPKAKDFEEYLVNLRTKGFSPLGTRMIYAHLNKVFHLVYDQRLDQWPHLFKITQKDYVHLGNQYSISVLNFIDK